MVKAVRKINFLLVAIFLLGLYLRVLGTHPGYPPGHPDESTIADSALKITLHHDFKPVGYYYGSIIPIVYAIINIFFFVPLFIVLILPLDFINSLQKGHTGALGCILDQHKDWLVCITTRSKYYFEFLGRYDTAILGALSVILVYILAKKLFKKEIGLIAAFYAAVNYRHVLSSTLSLADAPASFFALLSVIFSTRIVKNTSFLNYMVAGVGLGLAFSAKYFIYVLPTLFFCHLIAQLQTKGKTLVKKMLLVIFSPQLVVALCVSVVVFFLINPFLITDYKVAQSQLTLNANRYGGILSLSDISYVLSRQVNLFPLYYLFKFGLGELMSFTLILGFFYALFRYTVNTLIISSVVLPFLFSFLLLSGTPNVRNYASIIPFLLIFPAVLTYDAAKKISSKAKYVPFVCLLLALTLGYHSLKNSFLSSNFFSKTNNFVSLSDWILTEIPDNSILVKSWGVPFPSYKNVNLRDWSPLAESYMSLEELKDIDAQWVIIGSDSGTYLSNLAWFYNNALIKEIFFDDYPLWDYLSNNYASLVTQEIGSYRVKEFIKPAGSLDPAYFVSKVPNFWEVKKDHVVTSFIFEKKGESEDFIFLSRCYRQEQANGLVLRFAGEEKIKQPGSSSLLVSPTFKVSENKWYTLSGKASLASPSTPEHYKSGFWRLDFYSNANQVLKTYVSRQLSKIDEIQELNAAGIAPRGAAYAKASFQIDECKEAQSHVLHDTQVFESDETASVRIEDYPYFYQQLPRTFIWQPPL